MSQNHSNIINFNTFRNEAAEWKRFARALLGFIVAPFILLIVVLELFGWHTGETVSMARAAQIQAESPDLIYMTKRQKTYAAFKLNRVDRERPEVLIMGQSRIGQLRASMFRPYSFYNLSRVSYPIDYYVELLRRLPEGYNPRVIIFDLDFYMFSPQFVAQYADQDPIFDTDSWFSPAAWYSHLYAIGHLFVEAGRHPELIWSGPVDSYYHKTEMGLGARITGNGFRQDGAEQWSFSMMRKHLAYPELLNSTSPDEPLFYYDEKMDDHAIAKFEEFTALARARGIALIGVQMPVYGPAAIHIESQIDSHYGILKDFNSRLASGYFDRLGVITFDFLDFPGPGYDCHYYVDPIHPTELLALNVVLKMAEDPRVKALLPKLDTATLQREAELDRKSDKHVYIDPKDY
jgi:hypothetical protein